MPKLRNHMGFELCPLTQTWSSACNFSMFFFYLMNILEDLRESNVEHPKLAEKFTLLFLLYQSQWLSKYNTFVWSKQIYLSLPTIFDTHMWPCDTFFQFTFTLNETIANSCMDITPSAINWSIVPLHNYIPFVGHYKLSSLNEHAQIHCMLHAAMYEWF